MGFSNAIWGRDPPLSRNVSSPSVVWNRDPPRSGDTESRRSSFGPKICRDQGTASSPSVVWNRDPPRSAEILGHRALSCIVWTRDPSSASFTGNGGCRQLQKVEREGTEGGCQHRIGDMPATGGCDTIRVFLLSLSLLFSARKAQTQAFN
ncbi:hypothetical protein TIFTF001_010868 [Ficus carica]|uniref:Uncharacterized protein n=1 Tax=Ficus carica TaxID=3494 RepID=A0AA88DHS2_FICCA|nr:hypothetical protein TIFTF001_010868 [Ficus carica]